MVATYLKTKPMSFTALLVLKALCFQGKGSQPKKAPEGATRCQVFARGISLYLFGSRAADQQWSLV